MEQKGTKEQEEAKLVDANEEEAAAPAKDKKKRKSRQKKRKEELKSKATGVGLKISVDSAPTNNKKIVFDDSNLPSDNDDDNNDSIDDKDNDKEQLNAAKQAEDAISDDDDAVEEVKGTAARDKALDQLKTEAEQSLKTKKKRKRKARPEKKEKDNNNSDDEEMDEAFFAELDSARKAETKERIALEKSAAREAMKGKHTTFVFQRNKEEEGAIDPLAINENIQVVVLNNNSSNTSTVISEKALLYSRNRLKDGKDPLEGPAELKRKRKRNGGEPQPWKRAKKGLATMGRSRLKTGKPAAFFKRKRR